MRTLTGMGITFIAVSTWHPDFVAAIRRHYTGSRGAPVGKKLAWRIEEGGTVVGWVGLGEPSFKLAPRRRLGLLDARPLPRTVSNFIYRLEGPREATASAILRLWHPVAAAEWSRRYGWEPEHWESMVGQGDTANPGACFKRAGRRCALCGEQEAWAMCEIIGCAQVAADGSSLCAAHQPVPVPMTMQELLDDDAV